jgi:hypothetical protein
VSDAPEKPWYSHLPAKLAAIVVFLVALTTLVGNVFELVDKRRSAAAPAPAPVTSMPAPARPKPATPSQIRLQLDRIIVQHDGSPGTTDWRFTVEVDGEPLFAFQQDELDEQGGRNVAMPDDAEGEFRIAAGRQAKVVVKGWRGSWLKFGADPDASGEGWLSAGGNLGVIWVQAQDTGGGDFAFHFSTTRVE